jgi:hypothetical protein
MFGKAITYKNKCLADNKTTKYEASVGPAENLPASVWRISKTLLIYTQAACIYRKFLSSLKVNIVLINDYSSWRFKKGRRLLLFMIKHAHCQIF